MKTEDILNLDCTKQENIKTLNNFLWKVKPVAKMLEKQNYTKTEIAPLEILEKAMQGICIRYDYRTQSFLPYYEQLNETRKFVFYSCCCIKVREKHDWIGTVYGKTLWELVAKIIVKLYADIKADAKKGTKE